MEKKNVEEKFVIDCQTYFGYLFLFFMVIQIYLLSACPLEWLFIFVWIVFTMLCISIGSPPQKIHLSHMEKYELLLGLQCLCKFLGQNLLLSSEFCPIQLESQLYSLASVF